MNDSMFSSSDGSGSISTTVGGFSLIGVAQVLAYVLPLIHIQVDQNTIMQILITGISVVGGALTIYGLLKKVYFNTVGTPAAH